jgi:hypothetical protein
MVAPPTCGRAAIRKYHANGAAAARDYIAGSIIGSWVNHSNASMASGAKAVVNGVDWYCAMDAVDGRPAKALDREHLVQLPAGDISARVDVVLDDGADLAGRIILWDGPDFDPARAPVMACVFALALSAMYPGRNFTTIGIWQARRQRHIEVPSGVAMAELAAASVVLAAM